jgi:hypothetical protein
MTFSSSRPGFSTRFGKRHDTAERENLRGADTSYYGLGSAGPFGVGLKKLGLAAGDKVVRGLFHSFGYAMGLYGYTLPNMDEIAEVSHRYYNNDLRGGEGHMEVGKLILNVTHHKAHMTLSVKPFGCMPSAGVSDGVQSAITEHFPGSIYCPVETSGDGRVNFYSRVQMYMFKAKQAAHAEFERVLEENHVTREQVKAFLDANPRFSSALHKSPHVHAGTAADLVAEVAPYITMSRAARFRMRVARAQSRTTAIAKKSPHLVVEFVTKVVREAPQVAARVKEDISIYRELSRAEKVAKAAPKSDLSAAAE